MDLPSLETLPEIVPRSVLVTGGTGLIGSALVSLLQSADCRVTVLTRDPERARRLLGAKVTCLSSLEGWPAGQPVHAIINLAGASLADGRWNAERKRQLVDSRVETTKDLFDWAQGLSEPPGQLLNASAVGYYGPQGDAVLTEDSSTQDSFSHDLCAAWEQQAERFETLGASVTRLRLGVVLARTGGAFEQMKRSFDMKVGTVMGSGDQWLSWVHLHDVLRAFLFSLKNPATIRGAVNLVAPEPVTYGRFADILAKHTKPWMTVKMPGPLMHLLVGEMADELLLTGQRVIPKQLLQNGFAFLYPTLDEALVQLLARPQ